jgi:hypothetical protein
LRQRRYISVEIRELTAELKELERIILTPRQSWGATMGGDDLYSELEWRSQTVGVLQLRTIGRKGKFPAGMSQQWQPELSHPFPKASILGQSRIDNLDARQEFQQDGASLRTGFQNLEGILPARMNRYPGKYSGIEFGNPKGVIVRHEQS